MKFGLYRVRKPVQGFVETPESSIVGPWTWCALTHGELVWVYGLKADELLCQHKGKYLTLTPTEIVYLDYIPHEEPA